MIEVKHLTKYYGRFCALNDCTFDVEQGEIFAFVGPNGAGKTTTIKILATVLDPTSGGAKVGGYSVILEPYKVRKLMGYMPDEYDLYSGVTVEDYLTFFAGLYNIPGGYRKKVVQQVSELVGISRLLPMETQTLSKGMKQRVALARILIHDPKVLVLDEPAHGLDPRARIEFRMILRELKNLGKTIFISSHILTELAEISDSVGIIDHGKIIAWGSITEIQKKLQPAKKYQIQVVSEHEKAMNIIRSFEDVNSVSCENGIITFEHIGKDDLIGDITQKLVYNDIRILEVKKIAYTMETMFMKLTQGEDENPARD